MVGETRGSCSLLTRDENDQVTKLLGHLCQSLATTVIQLFKTAPPDHTTWQKHSVGVLCLVKDSQRRSYFFRLYCLVRNSLIWEHEVYSNMEYITAKPFFHLFEAEGCIIGFNFAVEEEARSLQNILNEKMGGRRRKRERQSRQQHQMPGHAHTLPSRMGASNFGYVSNQNFLFNGSKNPLGLETQTLRRTNKEKDKRGKGRNLTKSDIGLPSNFQHVSHIGWDPNTGFALDNVEDPNLQQFFEQAGVSSQTLKDEKTRKFIYSFIEEHGGYDQVKKEVGLSRSQNEGVPPPVPVRTVLPSNVRVAPPPPPSRTGPPGPPPPPQNHQSNRSPGLPPPPRIRAAPLEPPRSYGSNNIQSYAPKSSTMPPPPPPPPSLTPPPPPPPPTSHIPPPPPGPPPSFSDVPQAPPAPAPAVPDARSALMEAIRSGATLRKVDTKEKGRGNEAVPSDSRAMLLDQIRQGKELRAVQPTTRPPPEIAQAGSLASALARALAERSRAIHSNSSDESGVDGGDDDDDDDDDDYDGDDWDD